MHRNRAVRVLFLAFLSVVTGWADQVVMKNGDRVTGSLIKKDGKSITIKTEQFGTVTAAWDQVESVKVDQPVTVVLQSGKELQGTVATSAGTIQVTAPDARASVSPAEITTIRDASEQKAYQRLLRPRWKDLWAGAATIGFAGTSGNARTTTFTTGVAAARVTRTDKASIYFNAIKASALVAGRSSETAAAVRGGIGYDHNVKQRLFANVFNDYEYDRFQNLDLRFVLGGGLGYHLVNGERSKLDVLAGAAYNRSSFSTPLVRNSAELYWGDEYALKLRGSTSLVQSFRMFNNLSNTGAYRVNFDVGASTRIAKWLTWNVAISDRYLSNPVPGRKTNDILYTTGLGFTFAR